MSKEKNKTGRQPMTETEKEKRKELFKTETIEQRTKRVLEPRINKFLKGFDTLLTACSSKRYRFSQEQSTKLLEAIASRYGDLETIFSSTTKKEIENIF